LIKLICSSSISTHLSKMQRAAGGLALLDKGEPLVAREAKQSFQLAHKHGVIDERAHFAVREGSINGDQHSGHLINRGVIAVQNIQNRQSKDLGERWRNICRHGVLASLPLRNRGLITPNPGSYLCLSEPLFLSCWSKMAMHGVQICA